MRNKVLNKKAPTAGQLIGGRRIEETRNQCFLIILLKNIQENVECKI